MLPSDDTPQHRIQEELPGRGQEGQVGMASTGFHAGKHRLLANLVALASIAAGLATARTWTDIEGRKLEANYVSSTETHVTLELANGRKSTLPMARLSEADREFARAAAESGEPTAPEKQEKPGTNPDAEETLNFDAPWPQTVRFAADPEIAVISEDKDAKRYVYESANYRFICDVRLAKQVVKGFAIMFEATHDYCRALPLAITGGGKTYGKYETLLFETKESYVQAGAPPMSAGVFISGRNLVMVPLTSLGVRQVGSGYMLDRDQSNGTLIHEITHQLTPGSYFSEGAMGWFSEGLAEYTTATPYRSGSFKVKSNFDDIVAYATAFGKDDQRGRGLGTEIKAPPLKDYMLMSYENFTGGDANFNYGFGLLLTTYFLHLDGKGDAARMKEFLKALRAGKKGQDAIDVLLDGRSYDQLQDDVAKGWKSKRITIQFGN